MLDEQEFLSDIAHMYYRDSMNQIDIAERLGVSRSMVSRFLDKALQKGIVEITIHYPMNRNPDLEHRLRSIFGIENIRVSAEQTDPSETRTNFLDACELAASYILSLLNERTVFSVAWGRAVASVVQAMRPSQRFPKVQVVQPFGSALPNQAVDGTAIIGDLAKKLGGKPVYLHVPLHVGNEQTRNMLLSDKVIKGVIRLAAGSDFIMTGIGGLEGLTEKDASWNNYLNKRKLDSLVRRGSVGHIFTRHFDINGEFLDIEDYKGIIGLSHEEYMKIPLRIGIAMGQDKVKGIVGALRGSFVNSLVTDSVTAREVLALVE